MTKKEQQDIFMELYRPIHERFVRYCQAHAYGLIEPDDLVNETVLQAFEKFQTLRHTEAFLHFLFGIARNLLRNQNRRLKFHGCTYNQEQVEAMPGAENRGEMNLEVELLYKALAELPDEQREAIVLYDISGFTVKEIMAVRKRRGFGSKNTFVARTKKANQSFG